MMTVSTIVEGDGEVQALPVLLRRLHFTWRYPRPIRVKRQKIVCKGELERYVEIAAAVVRESDGSGGVLVLLDADDDCPAKLGPELLARARRVVTDIPCEVVIVKREFESWLFAGKVVNLTGDLNQSHPDDLMNPKARLKEVLGRYSPAVDQAGLVDRMDLVIAKQTSASFAKLIRALESLAN